MSQGASNGAGQGAGKSFVSFSRPAAQRIAKAVRIIEAGDRSQPGLTYDHPITSGGAKVFRIATFTGEWAINSPKTVTFKYATNTPNTVSATNLFFPAAPASDCGIAKDGTAWFLVSVPMTQVSVITGVTLGTAGLQFTRAMLSVASTSTHSSVTIGTTACT